VTYKEKSSSCGETGNKTGMAYSQEEKQLARLDEWHTHEALQGLGSEGVGICDNIFIPYLVKYVTANPNPIKFHWSAAH
jgi:hypothetical protein